MRRAGEDSRSMLARAPTGSRSFILPRSESAQRVDRLPIAPARIARAGRLQGDGGTRLTDVNVRGDTDHIGGDHRNAARHRLSEAQIERIVTTEVEFRVRDLQNFGHIAEQPKQSDVKG